MEKIEKTNKILHMTGKVLPVTLEPITICAELEDGTVIESKEKIPELTCFMYPARSKNIWLLRVAPFGTSLSLSPTSLLNFIPLPPQQFYQILF